MKKWAVFVGIVTLAGMTCAPLGHAQEEQDLVVAIQVSPSMLVLGSPGKWVTVHADIPFGAVDTSRPITITLDGKRIKAVSWFADDCGDLVAKFELEIVQEFAKPPSAELLFEGTTWDGAAFTGTATIRVKGIGKK